MKRCWALALLGAAAAAQAAPARWPAACANALTRVLPGWSAAVPPADAARWARSRGWNPTVAAGDFDADGRSDRAALVSAADGTPRVAVCLARPAPRPPRLHMIDEPYCADVLYRARAGAWHENFETHRNERIRRDGISVSCFEKAGATYVLERGAFRQIVDSD